MAMIGPGVAYPESLFNFFVFVFLWRGEEQIDDLENWICESTRMKGHITITPHPQLLVRR